MAIEHSRILKVGMTLLATVVLLTLLFPLLILPLLPPLQPLVSQLFGRMRDVLAFLAFTTVIAVGIFSSQHKDVQSNTRKKPFLEHHPLGSIFGETENARDIADEDVHAFAPGLKQMQLGDSDDTVLDYSIERAPSAMINGSLLQKRSAWLDMEASREHESSVSKEGNRIVAKPKVMKKLHRKSSSLDESVNHELEFEAARASTPDRTPPPSMSAKSKPLKRVSFSNDLHPFLPEYKVQDESAKQPKEHTTEKQNVVSTTSPGDITMQADAFIAKFKEQMRMQRIESLYRRQSLDPK